MAPSITPWTNHYYTDAIGNNPSIRLYEYDTQSFKILNYLQYMMDLDTANKQGKIQWQLEYVANQFFDTDVIDSEAMITVWDKMQANDMYFQKYYLYNSVSVTIKKACVDTCKKWQLCSIMYANIDDYSACFNYL